MEQYILRDYQDDAVEVGIEFFDNKKEKKNGIIVQPTGSGKSLVIANIAKNQTGNTIVFQPSKELLEQNYSKYLSYGEEAAIYSASVGRREIGKITFATIGSIVSKPELFKEFNHAIIDECHLVSPNKESMYSKFFGELNIKLLGLTATPIRLKSYSYPERHSKLCMLDRQRPKTFSKYLHITQIKELSDRGYLAPVVYRKVSFDQSGLKLNTTGADYTDRSMQKELEKQNVNHNIVMTVRKLMASHHNHILIFVTSILDAQIIARAMDNTAFVTGQTPKKERASILNQFKAGIIKCVVNVGVLVVGFDFPALDTIIIGRPTLSLAIYYQMIGRGIRPYPDKKYCTVIDFVGNYDKFGKIEDLSIELRQGGWGVFNGDRQLTNVNMNDTVDNKVLGKGQVPIMNFGKHKDKKVTALPDYYLKWMVEDMERKPWNTHIVDYVNANLLERIYGEKQPDNE